MKPAHAIALAAATLALNLGLTAALLSYGQDAPEGAHLKAVGAKLQGAGLKGPAADAYLAYLAEDASSDQEARATIALTAGRLLAEVGRYEDALVALYTVEALAPGSPAAKEASKDIVAALERSGNSAAARTAMASRTRIPGPKAPTVKATPDTEDPVVARAGDLTLRRSEAQALRATLPGVDALDDRAFLQQALARAALLRKAQAANLAAEPEVSERIRLTSEEILISALAASRAGPQPPPTEAAMQAYVDAHKDRFGDAPLSDIQPQVQAMMAMEAQAGLYQQLVEEGLRGQKIDLYPERLGDAPGGGSQ